MKNRWLMGHQRLSMEGKLVYRTSLRKRGWENFIQEEENWGIHIALGEDGTAGRFWNRNVRTVSSEKWRHTYCMSAIKCASLSLSEKLLVVFLSRVENHKRHVSDTVVFPSDTLPSLVKKQVKKSSWKEDFFFSVLSFRVQQAGPAPQGQPGRGLAAEVPYCASGAAEPDQRAGSGSDTARRSPGMSTALRWVRGQASKSVSSSGPRNGKRN